MGDLVGMEEMAETARRAWGVFAGLVLSATPLALGPIVVAKPYSWVSQTTSGAAQALEGAGVSRLGFLLFGLGVLWLGVLRKSPWGRIGWGLHLVLALAMIASAVVPRHAGVYLQPYLTRVG